MSDGREEREEREKRLEQELKDRFGDADTVSSPDRLFDRISDRLDPYPSDPWEPERRES